MSHQKTARTLKPNTSILIRGMDYTNLLAAIDVMDDLIRELNIAPPGSTAEIPLWNHLGASARDRMDGLSDWRK
jgi:hypothetical protein